MHDASEPRPVAHPHHDAEPVRRGDPSVAEPIAINQMHAWEVKVTSPAGAPVLRAQIDVDGGMPQHGHGLPTRPRVTRELGDGRYLIEGMKFSMTGWWELKLNVQSEGVADQVTFNKVIALPAPSKT
jgi:hypothetical protein